ncbi:MAG: HPF/RaiA family ribosome-associated protein [Patescibacteria group bacterium]
MEITTRVVDIVLTDQNNKHIDAKCSAFAKRFRDAVLLNLEIKRDRHHRKGEVIHMRATLSLATGDSALIHGESDSETFVRALDEVLVALSRQLERLKAHPRRGGSET